jgi:hypothetical protein
LPGSGGRKWVDSTIRGHIKRGTGIINNELYVGRLIWNRQHFVKDPATGKRLARMNPPEQWVIQDLPHLSIISTNLWKSVKAKQNEVCREAKEKCSTNLMTGSRRDKYFLSGLLICGECQGGFTLIAKDKYGCANRRNNGTCNNSFMISRKEIEQRILAGLHDKLLEPSLLTKFIDDYIIEVEKLVQASTHEQGAIRKELLNIEKKLAAVINAIEQGIITDTTKSRLLELETKKKELSEQLVDADFTVPKPDKNLIDIYRQQVKELSEGMASTEFKTIVMDSLRSLIDRIVLQPKQGMGRVDAELYGDLANLVAFEEKAVFSFNMKKISVVAGARFELTTFRL